MNDPILGKMPARRLSALVAACAMGLSAATTASAAGVTDKMIANDATTTNDVLTVGLGQSGQRFSSLKTINSDNVGDLVPAWTFSFGGEKQRGQERASAKLGERQVHGARP